MVSTQFTLYAHPGPNTLKVAILLEKLGLSYKLISLEAFSEEAEKGMKGEDFLAINPNGRVPAIVDHNANDFAVWESGAILLYLTEVYDKQGKFFGKTPQERAVTAQWLTFQLSGLGPVQGNLNFAHIYWKKFYNEEPSKSVFTRFEGESHRLYKILDDHLALQAQHGSQWIALDRPSIADFAFYPWVRIAFASKLHISQYTNVAKWRNALASDKDVETAQTKQASM